MTAQRRIVKSIVADASRLARGSLNATVGGPAARDLAIEDDAKPDLFSYVLGGAAPLGAGFTASPFARLRAGARRYDYRGRPSGATHNLAVYARAVGELGKVEFGSASSRALLTDLKPISGATGSDLRNEVNSRGSPPDPEIPVMSANKTIPPRLGRPRAARPLIG